MKSKENQNREGLKKKAIPGVIIIALGFAWFYVIDALFGNEMARNTQYISYILMLAGAVLAIVSGVRLAGTKAIDSMPLCDVCGKKIIGSPLKVNDSKNGGIAYQLCSDCNRDYCFIAGKDGVYPDTAAEIKEIIAGKANAAGIIEKRMRCNVCGTVFCYSNKDVEKNNELLSRAASERRQAVLSALGTSAIQSNQETARADRLESMVKDYSKCPKCNSADIVEISEEEYKAFQASNERENNKAASSADELMKFKELLDSGVITQEEFDVKKKQLLGL